jgi:hypothetical protein
MDEQELRKQLSRLANENGSLAHDIGVLLAALRTRINEEDKATINNLLKNWKL